MSTVHICSLTTTAVMLGGGSENRRVSLPTFSVDQCPHGEIRFFFPPPSWNRWMTLAKGMRGGSYVTPYHSVINCSLPSYQRGLTVGSESKTQVGLEM